MEDAIYRCSDFIAEAIVANKEYLTDLDAAIGDGDHGINMARGVTEMMKAFPKEDKDIGSVVKKVAMVLLSKVGGASGPLYASGLLKAAAVLTGMESVSGEVYGKALEAALEGIKARGKAAKGEKTMIDALEPAAEAAVAASKNGQSIEACLKTAADASEQGLENTIGLKATKGRASYLGERSIGHKDPGAASMTIILKALSDFYSIEQTGA